MNKKQQLTKELFDMVYGWGKYGVITDENCNAFQETLQQIIDSESPELK